MTTNIKSSTPKNERDMWRTPQYIFDYSCKLIGGIDFDTACNWNNKLANPVWNGFINEDALTVSWSGKLWCNPPYSDIGPWVDKAISSNAITVMLIPSPNGESYYSNLIVKSHEIAIQGRISFIGEDGKPKNGNTRGSSLFIINGYAFGSRSVINRDAIR